MISRRTFLPLLGSGAASLLAAPSRPNIVLVFCDDLGYGDLGCYGHPTIRTPNIDSLARDGVRFTQFYAASPVCSPSRAALLTGRYPIRSGVSRVLFPYSDGGIPASEVMLPELLKTNGYRTGIVGKWHLGHHPQYLPTRHGFDSYFGIPYSNDMTPVAGPGAPGNPKYPPLPLMRDERIIDPEPDQSRLTERYTAEVTQFIRSSKGQPFFLYYPQTFPHVPLYAGAKFKGKSPRGLYGDVVEEIDWSVGEILRTLRQTGQERNTLVMFASDNGPWLVKGDLGGSAGLLREGKQTTWDGGMRVPFLARWPGRIPGGQVTSTFACTMDLLPTLCRFTGAKPPADRILDGAPIDALLEGKGAPPDRPFFYWDAEDLRAVRHGPWKLHISTKNAVDEPRGVQKPEQPLLYNLDVDPSEKRDVAAQNPGVVQQMLAHIDKHRASIEPVPQQR